MQATPFPATPSEVVALTVPEFAGAADWNASVSIDAVCERFLDDANRALVWLIRFRALTAWCAGRDAALWLQSDLSHARRAREVAASFRLNDDWEFDADLFRAAVQSVG